MSFTNTNAPTTAKDQAKDLLNKEDRQMFMELGFVATSNFLSWEGHALFGQLLLAEPEQAYPRVGLAYCKIMGGQFDDAHKLLNHPIVEKSSLKDYATALRAFAFYLEKKPQEVEKLFKASQDTLEKNAPALALFQNLLESNQ